MTDEKRTQFAEAVLKDEETIKKYSGMDAKELAEMLTSKGYDFTEEDVKEIAKELKMVGDLPKDGELSEEDLEKANGGFALTGLVVCWAGLNVAIYGAAYALSRWY